MQQTARRTFCATIAHEDIAQPRFHPASPPGTTTVVSSSIAERAPRGPQKRFVACTPPVGYHRRVGDQAPFEWARLTRKSQPVRTVQAAGIVGVASSDSKSR